MYKLNPADPWLETAWFQPLKLKCKKNGFKPLLSHATCTAYSMVDGRLKTLLVHRKGATRAFPPHHPLIPVDYQYTGQPVLIGGGCTS